MTNGLKYTLPIVEGHCQPVFLVGMNGSGTTMLRDCLNRHPELYGFPKETRLIPKIIKLRDSFGSLENSENFSNMWEEVLRIPAFYFANNDRTLYLPENWAEFPRDLEHVIDGVFRYFSTSEGKTRWCEKTPQYLQHMLQLKSVFPEAKFIHIVRDGRDCAASFNRRWGRNQKLTIYRWKKAVNEGKKQGAEIGGDYFELKYEDITGDPEYWMNRICEHIDLRFHPDILISRHPNMSNKKGKLGSIEQNSGKWRDYFNKEELISIENIAGSSLKSLGYTHVSNEGNSDPGKIALSMWRLVDYVKQYHNEIVGKAKGESHKSWQNIIRLPYVAFKQWRMNKY